VAFFALTASGDCHRQQLPDGAMVFYSSWTTWPAPRPRDAYVKCGPVFLFGTATLILHDLRLIQWKPRLFFWLASIAPWKSLDGQQTLTHGCSAQHLGNEEIRVAESTGNA